MGNNNDFKAEFNKLTNGQNSIIDDEGELLNYDYSVDKPGAQSKQSGNGDIDNITNTPKDLPLYGKKSKI